MLTKSFDDNNYFNIVNIINQSKLFFLFLNNIFLEKILHLKHDFYIHDKKLSSSTSNILSSFVFVKFSENIYYKTLLMGTAFDPKLVTILTFTQVFYFQTNQRAANLVIHCWLVSL